MSAADRRGAGAGGTGGAGAGGRGTTAEVAVYVRYLSAVRDKAGTRTDELRLPAGSTLESLADWIGENRGITLPAPSVMSTLNGYGWSQLPAGLATVLQEGDEVALFPLLSGG